MEPTTGVLVSVNETVSNDYVMMQAIDQAQRDDATLVVAYVMPMALYESRQQAVGASPNLREDGFSYTMDQAQAQATAVAARAAHTAVGDSDVDYVVVGAVGNLGHTLLELAEEYECGTIILPEERSWWRRRLGWDDRSLAQEFPGQVLLIPREKPLLVDPDPIVVEP